MINDVTYPPEFQGRWYAGGRADATAIGSWLADNKIHSAWYAQHEEKPERLVIELDDADDLTAEPGVWIVLETSTNLVKLLSDDEYRLTVLKQKKLPVKK
jgi:hypothetical protein